MKGKMQIGLIVLLSSFSMILVFLKNPVVNKDGIYYLEMAQHLFKETWGTTLFVKDIPFVPFLIWLIHGIIPDWVLCGQILSMLSFLLSTIVFYSLAKEIFGEKISFVSSLFMAFAPTLQLTSSHISRDQLFLLFFLLFFWNFYWIQKQGHARHYLGAFFSLFFALLCRIEGLLMLAMYFIFFLSKGIRSENSLKRRGSIFLILCLLSFFCIEAFTPYGQLSKITRFQEISNAICHPETFYQDIPLHSILAILSREEEKLPGAGYNANLLKITQNYFLLIYLIGFVDIWIDSAFTIMFLLGFLGLYKQIRYEKNPYALSLFYWMFFLLLPPYLFLIKYNHLSTRYLVPPSVILYFFTGTGFYFLWDKLQPKLEQKGIFFSKYFFLALLLSIPFFKIALRDTDKSNFKEAGEWMLQNIPGQVFVTNDARLLFYSGLSSKVYATQAVTDSKEISDWLQRAKELDTNWIFIEEKNSISELGKPVKIFFSKKKNLYLYRISSEEKE